MKRLEGEVRDMLQSLGETQTVFEGTGHTVDPHQFLGIEINPRAAAIAELVLWIGYLQWHFRTFGAKTPAEPIIKPFHNIECRDAVLEYDRKEPVLDADLQARHPLGRHDVQEAPGHRRGRARRVGPDAGLPIREPAQGRLAEGGFRGGQSAVPRATGRCEPALGDGYAETLRTTYPGGAGIRRLRHVLVAPRRRADSRRGNFDASASSRPTAFARPSDGGSSRLTLDAKEPLSLAFAIPDHPWVDEADGADVRIAMTVGEGGRLDGCLDRVVSEETERPGRGSR